jgi:hypothetical protein
MIETLRDPDTLTELEELVNRIEGTARTLEGLTVLTDSPVDNSKAIAFQVSELNDRADELHKLFERIFHACTKAEQHEGGRP